MNNTEVFVEKILRAQPNVKKLFLLARASTAKTAEERLHGDVSIGIRPSNSICYPSEFRTLINRCCRVNKLQVFGKDLFDVLKQKHGGGFDGFIREKIQAVSGDVTDEDLGIFDASLLDQMLSQIDVVVNIAATTKFDER